MGCSSSKYSIGSISFFDARVAAIFKSGKADYCSAIGQLLSPGCLNNSYMIYFTSTSILTDICSQISTDSTFTFGCFLFA